MSETSRMKSNEDKRPLTNREIFQDIGSQIQRLGEKISSNEDCGPDDANFMHFSRVIALKEIGKGRNGTTVFKGTRRGLPVAIKRFPNKHINMDDQIFQRILSHPHENVVDNLEFGEYKESAFMISELCDYSLEDLISMAVSSKLDIRDSDAPSMVAHKHKLSLLRDKMPGIRLWAADGHPSEIIVNIMRQVLLGVRHLHKNHIAHGDLKTSNVLMVNFEDPQAKISDAGIIKCLHGHQASQKWPGSQAPELLYCNQRPTFSSDMFSVGCIFYYCVTRGRHPFGEFFERDANIQHYSMNKYQRHQLTAEAHQLISALLSQLPEDRPTALDALEYPFFWSPEKRMEFLCDMSDKVQFHKANYPRAAFFTTLLGLNIPNVKRWQLCLDPMLLADLSSVRYDYTSLVDLLRMLRNKWVHKSELSQQIKTQLFHPFPQGQEKYFSKKYPLILTELYKVASQFFKNDPSFEKYFKLGDH